MRQKKGVVGDSAVGEPALKAGDPAFAFGASTGRLIGDLGELGLFGTHNPANQGQQGMQVSFAMAVSLGRDDLSQRLFYGTIAAMGVTDGMRLPALQWYESAGRAYQMGHPLRQHSGLKPCEI
jgi:hypothetical protein